MAYLGAVKFSVTLAKEIATELGITVMNDVFVAALSTVIESVGVKSPYDIDLQKETHTAEKKLFDGLKKALTSLGLPKTDQEIRNAISKSFSTYYVWGEATPPSQTEQEGIKPIHIALIAGALIIPFLLIRKG